MTHPEPNRLLLALVALALVAACQTHAPQKTPDPQPAPTPAPPPAPPTTPTVVTGLNPRGLIAGLLVADFDGNGAEGAVAAFDAPEEKPGPGLVAYLNPQNGSVRWQTSLPGPVFDGLGMSPHLIAVPGGVAVVAKDRKALVVLDAKDGTQRWRWAAQTAEHFGREGFRIAYGANTLLLDLPFTPDGRTFLALDAQTGTKRWRTSLPDAYGPLLFWPRFSNTHVSLYAGERTHLLRLKDGQPAPGFDTSNTGQTTWTPSNLLAWRTSNAAAPRLHRFDPETQNWTPTGVALKPNQRPLTEGVHLTDAHVIVACEDALCGVPRTADARPWTMTLPKGWRVTLLGAEEFGPASHSDDVLPRYTLTRLEPTSGGFNAPQRWAVLDLKEGKVAWSSPSLASGPGTTPHGALITWRAPHYVLAAPASGSKGALWRVWMTLNAETGVMTPPQEIQIPIPLIPKPPYSGPLFATLGAHYMAGGVASDVWIVHLDSARLAAMTSPGFKVVPAEIAEEVGPIWQRAR